MNTILPEGKVRTKERVLRYIQRVNVFTVKDVARGCKIRKETARYHIRELEKNLLVQDISTLINHSTYVQYRYVDLVPSLLHNAPGMGQSEAVLLELKEIAFRLRQGHIVPLEVLDQFRLEVDKRIEFMRNDLEVLTQVAECKDLWNKNTLVKRITFDA